MVQLHGILRKAQLQLCDQSRIIALFLKRCDDLLGVIQRESADLILWKKALMQLLLTGIVRVKS